METARVHLGRKTRPLFPVLTLSLSIGQVMSLHQACSNVSGLRFGGILSVVFVLFSVTRCSRSEMSRSISQATDRDFADVTPASEDTEDHDDQ